MNSDWLLRDSLGDAGEFHSADPQPRRSATFHMVAATTLVLGSVQRASDVDQRVAEALAITVVRRRSGGGAVLLVPGEFMWFDLVIPSTDPLWLDDVGQAMVWVGEVWQRAFAELGIEATVNRTVTNTPMRQEAPWSRQVCFAGSGLGEVVADGKKLVGVSQRRTRVTARFQSLCHFQWRPELVAALVAEPRPSAPLLAAGVATIAAPSAEVRAALTRNLLAL